MIDDEAASLAADRELRAWIRFVDRLSIEDERAAKRLCFAWLRLHRAPLGRLRAS
jgi:hypothetical protein